MARKGLPGIYLKRAWKMKGSTKKNALKRAWALYRGKKKSSSKSSSTKTKSKRKSKTKGVNRTGKRKFTLPMALVSGAGLGFVIKPDPSWYSPYEAVKAGKFDIALKNYATNMIGYRADTGAIFDTQIGMKGLWALIGGFVIHKIASIIGLNRALGRAGIPYLRV